MESAGPTCKHEFVRIYQRKLKGLERRLVATKAYLPVGFKMTDFGHLSEGSYCFCTKCRTRLFPKRTAADRAQARLDARAKLANAEALEAESLEAELADSTELQETVIDDIVEKETSAPISVDELEVVALELDELGDTAPDTEKEEEEDDDL